MAERTVFGGITFYRYPGRRYWTSGKRGTQALHQEVWKSVHGPIPAGCDIHHIDFNHDNNALDNLVCLTEAEHHSLHARAIVPMQRDCERCGRMYGARSRKGDEKYCSPACKAAARRASGVDDETRQCAWCGAEFSINRYETTRNCSKTCAQRFRAKTR